MIWLLTRPIVWPVRSAGFAASTGYRTGRLLGFRRLSWLGLGVVIGLLVAPVTGRELRRRLQERLLPAPVAPPSPTAAGAPLAPVVDLRATPAATTA